MHIYSTLANDVNYAVYAYDTPLANGHRNARKVKDIIIKGGTNVAVPIKRRGGEPYTPVGVYTEVSNEEYEHLAQDSTFKEHLDRGFVRVENRKVNTEKAVTKMDLKDKASPKTPETDKEARIPVAKIN